MSADIIVAGIIEYLKSHGCLDLLPAVAEKLTRESYSQIDPYQATVVTAVPLTAAQKQAITNSLSRTLGHKIKLKTKNDPLIIAGMKIFIAGKIIDSSYLKQLQDLNQEINYD